MVANCHGSDEPTHDANGKFAPGNQLGGSRLGVPNRAAWIRDQILATCDEKRITELKNLDAKLFWDVICKVMPKQIEAEVGTIGSIDAECDAALKRAGLEGKCKTELGE